MTARFTNLPETLVTPRTDAVYNCHAYLTKVPLAAIRPFIEAFTEPGDLVVDFFAGSGMTGLAAVTVGRNAVLSDISMLGRHIATGHLTRVDPNAFRKAAEAVMAEARSKLGDLYGARNESTQAETEMVRTVWSFSYRCPGCSTEIIYFQHITPSGAPPSKCPSCDGPFARRVWPRGADVPVHTVVRGEDGRLSEQAVQASDRERIATACSDKRLLQVPSLKIDEHREMFSRSGLGKSGLFYTKDFFSARNAIALFELWNAINRVSEPALRQKLRFAFTAILTRASKRYQWGPKRPLNAQNQTYYIAPIYYEWNIFELFERKVSAAIRASGELFSAGPLFESIARSDASYTIESADRLEHLATNSVDYVFTDPPFGSNIFYSDMNLFHEAWLGDVTDPGDEAVVHTTGTRKNGSAVRYEALLRAAFAEGFRVLKPGRYMSVVFGNSSGSIWGLMQRALRDSGFDPAPVHVAVLDKGQRSVKGLNSGSESVVTVDLILTVRKPQQGEIPAPMRLASDVDSAGLILKAVSTLGNDNTCNPSHLYARILRQAIQYHLPLDQLHLSDVLVALRGAGFIIDRKTGLLIGIKQAA